MTSPLAIPADAQLPQLAQAIDAAAMQPVFDRALRRNTALRVSACRVERIKYRPGNNCTVSYRLEINDQQRGQRYEQRVAGRFCSAGKAAARHDRNRPRLALRPRCGVPALLLPEIELFAWFLPNDPRLAALPALCDAVQDRGSALVEAADRLFGERCTPRRVEAALVQYVPESRACARFDIELADGRNARLFAKLDRDDGGAATQRVMQTLYDSPARREGRLLTPRPLLWQAHTGLHWQQAVAGEVLLHRHALCPPRIAAAVGETLAALHDTPVALARRVGGDDVLGRLRVMRTMLGRFEPRWSRLLEQITTRLAPGLNEIRALPCVTLHGDLHPRNILIDEERLALIDLDGARCGPAVIELGAWVADGLARAQLANLGLAAAQETAAATLDGYHRSRRPATSRRLLAWATSLALLERAFRNVANLKRDRLGQVPSLLALSAMIAGNGEVEHPLPAM